MKKIVKLILIIVGLVLAFIIIDTAQALVFNNNTIIGIETHCMKRSGIFVDTYHCGDKNITRLKKSNLCNYDDVCSNNTKYTLIDKSKYIKDFTCAEALQGFYEDDNYIYYYECIKSDYIVVKYSDGKEETVEDALKKGLIKITDLDEFNIKYYKDEK